MVKVKFSYEIMIIDGGTQYDAMHDALAQLLRDLDEAVGNDDIAEILNFKVE